MHPWWQWVLMCPGWYLGGAMFLSHVMRKRDLKRGRA